MSDSDNFIKLLPEILDDPATAKVYNPVVCYGSPVALYSAAKWADNVIADKHPEAEIVRISGHAFIDRLLHAMMEGGDVARYAKSCCNGDILILTELESFSGQSLSSENLYSILNEYLLRGHKILVFSDTPPSGIPKLAPRIRAQLEGGILLDLGEGPLGTC